MIALFLLAFSSIVASGKPKRDPQARVLRVQGIEAMKKGDFESALISLDSALEREPTDFNAHLARAKALKELNRVDDAMTSLDTTIQLKKNFREPRLLRAEWRLAMDQDLDLVEEDLSVVLAAAPHLAPALSLQRELHSRLAAHQSAKDLGGTAEGGFYDEAFADGPVDAATCASLIPQMSSAIAGLPRGSSDARALRIRRARCFFESGDVSGAIEDTRAVLGADKNDVRALTIRGHALYALGEAEAASQHFNLCTRNDPDNKECRWNWKRARSLARALKSMQESRESRSWKDVLKQVDLAAQAIGSVMGQEGKAVIAGPHAPALLLMQCLGLSATGQHESAIAACRAAGEHNPADDEPLCELGDVLRRLGRYDEAVHAYSQASQRNHRSQRAARGKQQAERERKIANRKDYYKLLGVSPKATLKEIKRAHRKMAAKWHPDKSADGDKEQAEKMYMELGDAIEVLGDEEKRRQYDQGSDLDDIRQAEQHANNQKHQQHANPFGGRGFKFNF